MRFDAQEAVGLQPSVLLPLNGSLVSRLLHGVFSLFHSGRVLGTG